MNFEIKLQEIKLLEKDSNGYGKSRYRIILYNPSSKKDIELWSGDSYTTQYVTSKDQKYEAAKRRVAEICEFFFEGQTDKPKFGFEKVQQRLVPQTYAYDVIEEVKQ